jgi:hypothetical protein
LRTFWPVGESAQGDYEQLRAAVLAGIPLVGVSASRFERAGLAGLIVAPSSEAVFAAVMIGAQRPPWTPHGDPRLEALADGYGMVVGLTRHDSAGDGPTYRCMAIRAGDR